jgi:hypothetical protein
MNDPHMNPARTTIQHPQHSQRFRRVRLFPFLLILPILLVVLTGLTTLLLVAPSSVSAQGITGGPIPHMSSTEHSAHHHALMPAGAPSCFEQGCNFTNPYATECAGQSWDSWWVVLSGYLRDSHGNIGGYVQLWWSATCQTNWTRVVSYHTPYELEALIRLQNGYGNNANATISDQFYAPTEPACSYGAVWLGSGYPTYAGQVSQYQGEC